MPFPIDMSHCLALAPRQRPLAIKRIPFEQLRALCAGRGLRDGDQVTVTADSDGYLRLEKPGGKALLLEREYAVLIETEPLRHPVATRPRAVVHASAAGWQELGGAAAV